MIFRRLDTTITAALTLILAAMISAFAWRVGSRQSEIYRNTVTENQRMQGRILAGNAAHFLVVGDFAGLEDYMRAAAQLPDMMELQVMEPDGRLLCSIERSERGAAARVVYRDRGGPVPRGEAEHQEVTEERYVVWQPVLAGTLLGWQKLSFSLDPIREMQRSLWMNSLFLGILWLLVGVALMVMILRRPLSAVRHLAAFAHDMNRRKGEQLSLPSVSLEIDQLTSALNYASSELHDTERQLLAERERLDVTIRSIDDGVVSCDGEGTIMVMNPVAGLLAGWDADQAIGRKFGEVFTIIDEKTGERIEPTVGESGRVTFGEHAVVVSRDGTHRNITAGGTSLIGSKGERIGIVVVMRDETQTIRNARERGLLEEQLRHSQKMEAVGQLAGGIAHDFNNILTAIIGYAEMLRSMVLPGSPSEEVIGRLLNAAERAAGLTRSLLAFSRKQKMDVRTFDLNSEILSFEKMLRRLIGEDVELRIATDPRPLIVSGDPGQLAQVLINLATNARDAMPAGGLLTIQASRAFEKGDDGVSVVPVAVITVSDTGQGISEDIREKIFDPFFTTKEVGKGTGLGLSIVDGIIRQHRGKISVYSEMGIGTSFKISIPLAEGEEITSESAEAPPRGGTETILLVEDEDDVRGIAKNILETAGYHVIEASGGIQALHRIAPVGSVDLLLADVIMPRMNGRELAERIRKMFPAVRVLFMSGYTWDVIEYKGILEQGASILSKPFDGSTLLRKVREILDRPSVRLTDQSSPPVSGSTGQ